MDKRIQCVKESTIKDMDNIAITNKETERNTIKIPEIPQSINLSQSNLNEIEVVLGDYEFVLKDGKTYFVKKKPQYPKTNIERCEVLVYTEALGYTIDDIIFIKDTGWIRITKKFWDCYAEEHVYDGIDILNGHEYKDIRHHNVTGKMQLGHLKHCEGVDDVRHVNSIADDIMINQITNKVSVIKFKSDVCDNEIELQLGGYEIEVRDDKTYAVKKKSKYPKTYKECCDVLGLNTMDNDAQGYKADLIIRFQELIIARNAYWKIVGEQMELGKPWEPQFENCSVPHYCIFINHTGEVCNDCFYGSRCLLSFPTEEMRDAFFENFKDLIERCKELL